MSLHTVILPDELDQFVQDKVSSGQYQDASEVMQAALRTLKLEEASDFDKLEALRAAIDAGDASGVFVGDPFEEALRKVKPSGSVD